MKLNDWNIKDTSYTISFVGKSNVGKSSIINKLISNDLLHVSSRSSTTLSVCINHQSKISSYLRITDNMNETIIKGNEKIYKYIEELNRDIKNNSKKINNKRLEIFTDIINLSSNNTIIANIYDTPGYENDGIQEIWSQQTEEILKISKVIFYVIDYQQMDKGFIIDEYIKLKKYNPDIYFIINKIDTADDYNCIKDENEFNSFIEKIKREFIKFFNDNMKLKNIICPKNISMEIFPISSNKYNNLINDFSNFNQLITKISFIMNNSSELSIKKLINYCTSFINNVSTSENSMNNKTIYIPEKIKKYVDKYINKKRIIYGTVGGIGFITISALTIGIGSLFMTGGAVGVTSTLALLGGGSIASGGFGMLGGLFTMTSLIAISTGFTGIIGYKLYNSSDVTNAIKNIKDINLDDYEDEMYVTYKIEDKDKNLPFYIGSFKQFRYHGKGKILFSSGKKFMEGIFEDGKCKIITKIYNNDDENSCLFDGEININKEIINGIYYHKKLEIPISNLQF